MPRHGVPVTPGDTALTRAGGTPAGTLPSGPAGKRGAIAFCPADNAAGGSEMGRNRHFLKRGSWWAWHNERNAVVALAAALLSLACCAPLFAVSELAGLRTVRPLYPMRATTLDLAPGSYALDENPDASGFPADPAELTITGPGGPVRVRQTPYAISPSDVGGLLLGVGISVQAARFALDQAGAYRFSVTDPGAGSVLYLSEPFSTSFLRTGPWAVVVIAALITLIQAARRLLLAAARRRGSRPALGTARRLSSGTGSLTP
jgi:hypothetical protein